MLDCVKNLIDGYTEEQRAVIEKATMEAVSTTSGFSVEYPRSREIRQFPGSSQLFAVFGSMAMQLPTVGKQWEGARSDTRAESMPAILPTGETIAEFPEEGTSGILILMRQTHPREGKWFACYKNCGWLQTKELDDTPEQIAINIASDHDAGRIELPR